MRHASASNSIVSGEPGIQLLLHGCGIQTIKTFVALADASILLHQNEQVFLMGWQ
jgi:hypothetical protein